ncbi:MAG: transglutaminase family protein [Pseudomonadota bacterium]
MKLTVTHTTRYHYTPAAERLAFRFQLYPMSFESQRVDSWSVTVNGTEVPRLLIDGAGDGVGLWHAKSALEEVEIVAGGVVETKDTAGIVKGLPRTPPIGMYLRNTKLTEPDTDIRALAQKAQRESPLDTLHALSAAIIDAVTYRAGVTDSTTTARDALKLGAGVCQDHAHVFVSAARTLGMPARYVTGYLQAGADGAAEVESHAWAEVFCENLGWVGFDASNQISPTPAYIRLGSGLDAAAAAPIRGTLTGNVDTDLSTTVAIAEEGAQAQQQSQSKGAAQSSA